MIFVRQMIDSFGSKAPVVTGVRINPISTEITDAATSTTPDVPFITQFLLNHPNTR